MCRQAYTPGTNPAVPMKYYIGTPGAPGEVQDFVVDPTVETGYTPWVIECVNAW
eukprot:SAG22_NODE_73_length_22318_cov_47.105315_17_plen_54_part_00